MVDSPWKLVNLRQIATRMEQTALTTESTKQHAARIVREIIRVVTLGEPTRVLALRRAREFLDSDTTPLRESLTAWATPYRKDVMDLVQQDLRGYIRSLEINEEEGGNTNDDDDDDDVIYTKETSRQTGETKEEEGREEEEEEEEEEGKTQADDDDDDERQEEEKEDEDETTTTNEAQEEIIEERVQKITRVLQRERDARRIVRILTEQPEIKKLPWSQYVLLFLGDTPNSNLVPTPPSLSSSSSSSSSSSKKTSEVKKKTKEEKEDAGVVAELTLTVLETTLVEVPMGALATSFFEHAQRVIQKRIDTHNGAVLDHLRKLEEETKFISSNARERAYSMLPWVTYAAHTIARLEYTLDATTSTPTSVATIVSSPSPSPSSSLSSFSSSSSSSSLALPSVSLITPALPVSLTSEDLKSSLTTSSLLAHVQEIKRIMRAEWPESSTMVERIMIQERTNVSQDVMSRLVAEIKLWIAESSVLFQTVAPYALSSAAATSASSTTRPTFSIMSVSYEAAKHARNVAALRAARNLIYGYLRPDWVVNILLKTLRTWAARAISAHAPAAYIRDINDLMHRVVHQLARLTTQVLDESDFARPLRREVRRVRQIRKKWSAEEKEGELKKEEDVEGDDDDDDEDDEDDDDEKGKARNKKTKQKTQTQRERRALVDLLVSDAQLRSGYTAAEYARLLNALYLDPFLQPSMARALKYNELGEDSSRTSSTVTTTNSKSITQKKPRYAFIEFQQVSRFPTVATISSYVNLVHNASQQILPYGKLVIITPLLMLLHEFGNAYVGATRREILYRGFPAGGTWMSDYVLPELFRQRDLETENEHQPYTAAELKFMEDEKTRALTNALQKFETLMLGTAGGVISDKFIAPNILGGASGFVQLFGNIIATKTAQGAVTGLWKWITRPFSSSASSDSLEQKREEDEKKITTPTAGDKRETTAARTFRESLNTLYSAAVDSGTRIYDYATKPEVLITGISQSTAAALDNLQRKKSMAAPETIKKKKKRKQQQQKHEKQKIHEF